jgi:hypothetical protein
VSASREPDSGCVRLGAAGARALAVLLHVGVAGAGQPVDEDLRGRRALRLAVAPIGTRTRCLNFASR